MRINAYIIGREFVRCLEAEAHGTIGSGHQVRLEGKSVLKLGADGNIGLIRRSAGFLRLCVGFHRHGIVHGGSHSTHLQTHTRRLCRSISHHGLLQHDIALKQTPSGHASANGVDIDGGHAEIGKGNGGPPVAGYCVDALVPHRGQSLNSGGCLQRESIFGAGIGGVSESGKGQRQREFCLFPPILLLQRHGLSVDEPEKLQAHGIRVRGLVVQGNIGHTLGGESLLQKDCLLVSVKRKLDVGGAKAAAEPGFHGSGNGLVPIQEHVFHPLRNLFVLRPQHQDLHLCRSLRAPLLRAYLKLVNARRHGGKGNFQVFPGSGRPGGNAFKLVFHGHGDIAAMAVANLEAQAQHILCDDFLLLARTPNPSARRSLVLKGELSPGGIFNAHADGKLIPNVEPGAALHGLPCGVYHLHGGAVVAALHSRDAETEAVIGADGQFFQLIPVHAQDSPGAGEVVAAVALDAAGHGNIVPLYKQPVVLVKAYFEGGEHEFVHAEAVPGKAVFALPYLQAEVAVPEAFGDGEFARYGAVLIGFQALLLKFVALAVP